jgi:hypothetical protein
VIAAWVERASDQLLTDLHILHNLYYAQLACSTHLERSGFR